MGRQSDRLVLALLLCAAAGAWALNNGQAQLPMLGYNT
jgi:hypothetical protein